MPNLTAFSCVSAYSRLAARLPLLLVAVLALTLLAGPTAFSTYSRPVTSAGNSPSINHPGGNCGVCWDSVRA